MAWLKDTTDRQDVALLSGKPWGWLDFGEQAPMLASLAGLMGSIDPVGACYLDFSTPGQFQQFQSHEICRLAEEGGGGGKSEESMPGGKP
jgi:hypothetical protein